MISSYLYYPYFAILLWNLTFIHNKIWSEWNFRFYTISGLTWSFTVRDYHMICVYCLNWIDSSSVTLHLLYFCWMFCLWKASGRFVAMTMFWCTLQTHESQTGLVDSCNYTNTQQDQSFSEVTWCMGKSHALWMQPCISQLKVCMGVIRHNHSQMLMEGSQLPWKRNSENWTAKSKTGKISIVSTHSVKCKFGEKVKLLKHKIS
jgi:hypothetical protein